MKEKLITKTISKGSQDIIYKEVFEVDNRKLNIEIKSDSYNDQCYARISVLKPDEGWYVLHSIHYSQMKTKSELYYILPRNEKPGIEFEKYFTDDIKELKRVAEQLLDLN